MELFDEHLARALNRFRLVAKEASRLDVLLKFGVAHLEIIFGLAVLAEQIGSDDVDALVGALGGKNRRNQKLKSICMIQRAAGIGVGALEELDDFFGARFLLGFGFAHWFVSEARP